MRSMQLLPVSITIPCSFHDGISLKPLSCSVALPILPKVDVMYITEAVFNTPMSAIETSLSTPGFLS
jgi:hypothetical protein